MIRRGRVSTPQGAILRDGKLQIPPTDLPQTVLVEDEPVTLRVRYELMQHKPLGVVTAMTDPQHPTAFACLPAQTPLRHELRAVGRLDKETNGLLLWTTDGTLLHRITHPRYGIERIYHVGLVREPGPVPSALELDDGHRPEIKHLQALATEDVHPALYRPTSAVVFASITLTSGKFHEVRRIFAALGSHVASLCRVQYGPFGLPLELGPKAVMPVDLKSAFRGIHPAAPATVDDIGVTTTPKTAND